MIDHKHTKGAPLSMAQPMPCYGWKDILFSSVAMSVIGQCPTSAILLNNQNAKLNNGLTIDMLSLIMD